MSKNQEAEAELESFRQRWREEVSHRPKRNSKGSQEIERCQPGPSAPVRPKQTGLAPAPPASTWGAGIRRDQVEEFEPRTFHDLEDREDNVRLEERSQRKNPATDEPRSALDHYEKAVERETAGSLGDSVSLYRRAFKVGFIIQSSSNETII